VNSTPNSFRENAWRLRYDSASHNPLLDFYIPALERSIRYDRKAGFFNSSSLHSVARGLGAMLSHGGRIRLLMGCRLSPVDLAAIQEGLKQREELLATRLDAELTDPVSLVDKKRFELLAWLIANDFLDIRIVVPTNYDVATGRSEIDQRHMFHEKVAIFEDAFGNIIATNGSNNESLSGWGGNIESFQVACDWEGHRDAEIVAEEIFAFEQMWEGLALNTMVFDVPEAIRRRIIQHAPTTKPDWQASDEQDGRLPHPEPYPPIIPPLPPAPRVQEVQISAAELAAEREAFARLSAISSHPSCLDWCLKSIPVVPWPHQRKTLMRIADSFPRGFLVADEVGLGKTVVTGLILRYLLLSGKAKRILILAPASVQSQWHEEMRLKFNLHFENYDGSRFEDCFGKFTTPAENPWNTHDLILASSHLVRRSEREVKLLQAELWDLIVLDEAHHARRKSPTKRENTPNRLLTLMRKLKHRTKAIALLTATPMQIDCIEVFDLLDLLAPMSGMWAEGEYFCRYYATLAEPANKNSLDLWARMTHDYFAGGGRPCPRQDERNREADRLLHFRLTDTWAGSGRISNHKQLLGDPAFIEASKRYLATNTPLKDLMFRHTRDTLRQYFLRGLLSQPIPDREVQDIPVVLAPGNENDLYVAVSDYVRHFYNLAQKGKRKALGFLMTLYRRRLTSSFFAVRMSLQRRLDGLIAIDADDQADIEEADDAVLDGLESFFAIPPDPREVEFLEDLLRRFDNTGIDSKLVRFKQILDAELRNREQAIVFTQYTDTMDYLREFLGPTFGTRLGCYSGRGGEIWNGSSWRSVSKDKIKADFREGLLHVLLCTDSAAEGLNLQTCGVLVNYDLPWNPMRVEQRIGRVDRIGQKYPTVRIFNLLYDGTVEAKVYRRLHERIKGFASVVGALQPILARVPTFIEKAALSADPEENEALLSQFYELLEAPPPRPNIEDFGAADVQADIVELRKPIPPSPFKWVDIECLLTTSQLLKMRTCQWFLDKPGVWNLHYQNQFYRVTFDPQEFDKESKLRLLIHGDPLFESLLSEAQVDQQTHVPLVSSQVSLKTQSDFGNGVLSRHPN
jgi:ERCC4-related helicase